MIENVLSFFQPDTVNGRGEKKLWDFTVFWALFLAPFYQFKSHTVPGSLRHFWSQTMKLEFVVAIGLLLLAHYVAPRVIRIFMGSYVVMFWISSMLNFSDMDGDSAKQTVTLCVSALVFLSVSSLGMEHAPRPMLRGYLITGTVASLAQTITMLLYYHRGGIVTGPDGQPYYIFTHDNAAFFLIFPTVVLYWLYVELYQPKLRIPAYLFTAFVTGVYLYTWSATAMVCFVLFFAYVILIRLIQARGREAHLSLLSYGFNYPVMLLSTTALSILFTRYRIYEFFGSLLVNVLHKDITLSGRTDIWKHAWHAIRKEFWLGHGWEKTSATVDTLGINHPHNLILEVLYRGGMAGFVLYALAVVLLGWALWKYRKHPAALILCGAMGLYWFAGIFDFYLYRAPALLLYILVLGLPNLIESSPCRESYLRTKDVS